MKLIECEESKGYVSTKKIVRGEVKTSRFYVDGIRVIFDDVHPALVGAAKVEVIGPLDVSGEGEVMAPQGTKVFYSRKHDSFTRHYPMVPVEDMNTCQVTPWGKAVIGTGQPLVGKKGLIVVTRAKDAGKSAREWLRTSGAFGTMVHNLVQDKEVECAAERAEKQAA
jgi:hypothetical protein